MIKLALNITLLFLTLTASSQRLSSSVISSFGGSVSKLGLYLSHTVGQEGRVDSKSNGSLNIQQEHIYKHKNNIFNIVI